MVATLLAVGQLAAGSVFAAAPTNDRVMEVLKRVVGKEEGVELLGVGSWVGGGKYKDPLAAENRAKALEAVSDHDLRVILSGQADDAAALAKWQNVQSRLREEVIREFGPAEGSRVLKTMNCYPPEQLVGHAENAREAARAFQEMKTYPNLGVEPGANLTLEEIERRAAEGIYGPGKAAYVQSYEQASGKLVYRQGGKVFVGATDLTHLEEGLARFTPGGAVQNALQWAEKGREAFAAGDAAKLQKYLKRMLQDLKKARGALGVGGGAATGELEMLVRHLDSLGPDGLKQVLQSGNRNLIGRLEQGLKAAESDGRLLRGFLEYRGKDRELVRHLLTDPFPRWTKLRNAYTELTLKLPTEQIAKVSGYLLKGLVAYVGYALVKGTAATAGEQGFLEAAKEAGIEVAMFANLPLGLLAASVNGILEDAKKLGYGLAVMGQDCDNLLAGIHQVKGSEGFATGSTDAAALARRFAQAQSVKDFVFYLADQATTRDYGVQRGDATRQADEGKRKALVAQCQMPILRLWAEERLALQDAYRDQLLGLEQFLVSKPLVMNAAPNPPVLPKPNPSPEEALTNARVRSSGDWTRVTQSLQTMKQLVRWLGGKDAADQTYLYDRGQCTWRLKEEIEGELRLGWEESAPCDPQRLDLEREYRFLRAGRYLLELDWRLELSTSCPYCPVREDLDRTFTLKATLPLEVIEDAGLLVKVHGQAAGEREPKLLLQRALPLEVAP